MSSISSGSVKRRRGHARRVYSQRRAAGVAEARVLPCRVLPISPQHRARRCAGELLAELLPIVGEINAVLDPDELLPAIARQLRRIVDYRILDIFLPEPDGTLAPAPSSRATTPESPARLRLRPGRGHRGRGGRDARARVRARRAPGPALHLALARGAWPSWRSRSSTATGWWAC